MDDEEQHEIRVIALTPVVKLGHRHYTWEYSARCKCGWMGGNFPTHNAAESDGDEHRMAIR